MKRAMLTVHRTQSSGQTRIQIFISQIVTFTNVTSLGYKDAYIRRYASSEKGLLLDFLGHQVSVTIAMDIRMNLWLKVLSDARRLRCLIMPKL